MFFVQVMANASGATSRTPQIYFVPSFYVEGPSGHAMKEACKQLSLATGQVATFVSQNCADRSSQAAFLAGVEVPLHEEQSCYFVRVEPASLAEHAAQTRDM